MKQLLAILCLVVTFCFGSYSQGDALDTIPKQELHDFCTFDDGLYATIATDVYTPELGESYYGTIRIPLVFHVLHKGEEVGEGTNISDKQIYAAVKALNQAFSNEPGSDYYFEGGVDTEIQFYLAYFDPDSNVTNGITRHDMSDNEYYVNNGMIIHGTDSLPSNEMEIKKAINWPKDQYYNIWVVSEIDNNNGWMGTQGYAYMPIPSVADGTTILYNALGNKNLYGLSNIKYWRSRGTTLMHELGHALGLYHTFRGNSCHEENPLTEGDLVPDTPPTVFNPTELLPACEGTQLTENFMDYTNDIHRTMFTEGQKTRMRAIALTQRKDILKLDKKVIPDKYQIYTNYPDPEPKLIKITDVVGVEIAVTEINMHEILYFHYSNLEVEVRVKININE